MYPQLPSTAFELPVSKLRNFPASQVRDPSPPVSTPNTFFPHPLSALGRFAVQEDIAASNPSIGEAFAGFQCALISGPRHCACSSTTASSEAVAKWETSRQQRLTWATGKSSEVSLASSVSRARFRFSASTVDKRVFSAGFEPSPEKARPRQSSFSSS